MSSTKAQLEAVWDRSDQLAKLCDAAQGKLALLTSRYEMLVERSIDLSKLRPYDPRWNDENGMPVPQEVTLVAFGQVEAARAELEAVIRERREVIEEGERLLVIFIHEPIASIESTETGKESASSLDEDMDYERLTKLWNDKSDS